MPNNRWNDDIRLYPLDRVFAAVLAPCIPKAVRPNHLTVLRVLLIPAILLLLDRGQYAIGVPLFLLAALTDWFDGSLARVRRQITEWGIVYDPIADKLLIGSVLFLIVLEHVNFTLGMVLLAVEAAMVVGGWFARMRGGKIEPANIWGKIKMVSEVVGVLLLLIALWSQVDLFVSLSNGMLVVALVTALLSVYWRIR